MFAHKEDQMELMQSLEQKSGMSLNAENVFIDLSRIGLEFFSFVINVCVFSDHCQR